MVQKLKFEKLKKKFALNKVSNLEDEIEDLKTQLDNAILEEQ